MIFDGHKMYKIGNEWVFNITECTGYKVYIEDGQVQSFMKAFKVNRSKDGGHYTFERYMDVPAGVLRRATAIIDKYLREALVI